MLNTFFHNPYLLALLVGVYPIAFYISNNWYMFEASRSIFIFGSFSLIVFVVLGTFYHVLSWTTEKLYKNQHVVMSHRIFVLVSMLVLGYLLRHTFFEMADSKLFVVFLIGVTASIISWLTPTIQIARINIILTLLCLVNLLSGTFSILRTESTGFAGAQEPTLHPSSQSTITFPKKPNVYYIVPDGYPSREALKKVYDLDNTQFYQQLERSGFTLYHSAFSNYMSTLDSIGSSFNMAHHYYRGNVGSFELLHSREFITSEENSVVQTFKQNDYQVHFLHQVEYMFTRGCSIDFCYPNVFWGNLVDILLPWTVKNAIGMGLDQTLTGFEKKLLQHIENIAEKDTSHFLYVHFLMPAHSYQREQTPDDLRSHRKGFSEKIQLANDTVHHIVQRIIQRDPEALIIINADHGSWGLGVANMVESEVHKGLDHELIAIDHLGVLLAVRWPTGPPTYHQELRTNVNLFRYMFAYLADNEAILTEKTADNGFILKGQGKRPLVTQVVKDGKALERMVELHPVDHISPLR